MDYKRINTIVGWMVFIFATTVYFMTVEPTTSLWDCGEYITTAYKLEVGHPPGAPLFMMLGRLFTMFSGPEGAAMMVNLMSALSSSFTILFLFWTITMLGKKTILNPGISLFGSSTPSKDFDDIEDDSAKKVEKTSRSLSIGQQWAILGSGLIGAVAYTFTDSFWFSAVEGEVYAMSSFFTAIVIWAIFKWDHELAEQDAFPEDEELQSTNADRWIILIFFMIGLSIGVHLLNLLCVPVIAYVIYFRKYKEITPMGFILTGVTGVVALGLIQAVIIPKTVQIAGWFERFFVNSLGLSFNAGTMFFFLLMLAIIVGVLMWSKRNGKSIINTITWSATMIFVGYSCFAMIVIRSNANTPLDENDPENLVSLESYLKREQYGDWPILYGQYFNAERNSEDKWADRSDVYLRRFVVIDSRDNEVKGFKSEKDANDYASPLGFTVTEKYFKTFDGTNKKYTYKASQSTFFPRMYSSEARHVNGYKSWSGYTGDRTPTMGENLRYFATYQVDWMYWRYFMWNFSGRQSDEQGHGNARDGNWISGLNFIDKLHIGDQTNAPSIITENPSHNKYYMLPFILGLIGFIFMLTKSTRGWWLVMLLFLLTGFAIIIYLNQKPIEPRERDYAYAASFYAFAIFIGMSVLALYEAFKSMVWKELAYITGALVLLGIALSIGDVAAAVAMFYVTAVITGAFALMILMRELIKKEMQGAVIAIALTLPVPILMGAQAWDDHDRSNRYTAQALAQNYLNSCDDNAIIFTNGDNDTFPLWYLQEVEGTKTSVRVCNLSLLNTDWYTEQMTRKAYDSEPLPISFTEEQYRQNGLRDFMLVAGTNQLTMRQQTLDPKWTNVIQKKIDSNPELFQPAFELATDNLYSILSTTKFAEVKPDFLAFIPTMDSASTYFDFRTVVFNILKTAQEYSLTEQTQQAVQNTLITFNDAFDYLPADYAMKFLANDDPIDMGYSQKFLVLPSTGLSVEVDKQKVLDNGTVSAEYADRIVDKVTWKLPKTTIYKADLMILDMVAHFDWERPIYFASSADRGTYLGLDKYFFAEGLVYKLVPVQVDGSRNPNSLGEVNKTRMYENLMSTFKWGNMNEDGVLVDYYTRRLTNNYRVQFSVLADAYGSSIEKNQQRIDFMKQIQGQGADLLTADIPIQTPLGEFIPSQIDADMKQALADIDTAKARITEVINMSIEVMPHHNVPFGKVFPSYVSAYYVGGNETKAQEYSDTMFVLFEEEMNYYLDVDPKFSSNMIEDMYSAYRSIFSLYQASAVFGTDVDHQEKVSADFFRITQNVQDGLDDIKKYNRKAKNYSTLVRIEDTFDAFFKRINGQ
ncbi:MAG: MFS family permease [Crocinitomix sp.]|jgi:MFS family permease